MSQLSPPPVLNGLCAPFSTVFPILGEGVRTVYVNPSVIRPV